MWTDLKHSFYQKTPSELKTMFKIKIFHCIDVGRCALTLSSSPRWLAQMLQRVLHCGFWQLFRHEISCHLSTQPLRTGSCRHLRHILQYPCHSSHCGRLRYSSLQSKPGEYSYRQRHSLLNLRLNHFCCSQTSIWHLAKLSVFVCLRRPLSDFFKLDRYLCFYRSL